MGDAEQDLDVLLRDVRPLLDPLEMVYTVVPERTPRGVHPFATVREDEGLTLVAYRDEADRAGLDYSYVAARIQLTVYSALDAVGLTAAVAAALAEHGISCNVVAGYSHDHLLVPWERRHEAVGVLEALSAAG